MLFSTHTPTPKPASVEAVSAHSASLFVKTIILLNMGSGKRKKKTARKQSANIPTWLFDKNVSILLKREVEDALARHAVDNGITVGTAKFKSLTLQDICASLKLVSARWSAVEPGMINAAT